MKKKFLAVLLLAVLAGYAWLPYRAVARFEQAVRSADKSALKDLVDFPALRESIKAMAKEKALGAPDKKRDVAGSVGVLLAGAFVDKMVDEMVTPEVLAATLKLKTSGTGDEPVFREKRWSGWNEMTARGEGDTLLVFKLSGVDGWKVVGVRETGSK